MKKRIACFMTIMALLLCAFGLPVEAVGDVIDFTRDSSIPAIPISFR